MNVVCHELSVEEREVASDLWDVLVFSCGEEAKAAQQQMIEAPSTIQQALINAIVKGLRTQQELHALPNPFSAENTHERTTHLPPA